MCLLLLFVVRLFICLCVVLIQLDSGKRKAAIKLRNTQKRNALTKLFRRLKQEGKFRLCRISVSHVCCCCRALL